MQANIMSLQSKLDKANARVKELEGDLEGRTEGKKEGKTETADESSGKNSFYSILHNTILLLQQVLITHPSNFLVIMIN